MEQVRNTISIFEHTHPGCVSMFVFDQSSAHEGFAENALNVNSMNLHPGGVQKKLHDMIIPLNNPDPLAPVMRTHAERSSGCAFLRTMRIHSSKDNQKESRLY